MGNDLVNTVHSVEGTEKYDESVKALLANKQILGEILRHTVPAFEGLTLKETIDRIQDEPFARCIPVEPGLTNKDDGDRKVFNICTESKVVKEGLVTFDSLSYAKTSLEPDALALIDVEGQNNMSPGYYVYNRSVFYVSRIISSQKGRDFVNSDFNDMKPVYSIWLLPSEKENSFTYYKMSCVDSSGDHDWPGNFDLINIVFIGINTKDTFPSVDEHDKLYRFLNVLFTNEMKAEDKLDIFASEYKMDTSCIEREVTSMGSFGAAIYKEGRQEGLQEGRQEGLQEGLEKGRREREVEIDQLKRELAEARSGRPTVSVDSDKAQSVRNMRHDRLSLYTIAKYTNLDVNTVLSYIDKSFEDDYEAYVRKCAADKGFTKDEYAINFRDNIADAYDCSLGDPWLEAYEYLLEQKNSK